VNPVDVPSDPSQEPLEIFEPWTVPLPAEPHGAPEEEETVAVVSAAPEDELPSAVVSIPADEIPAVASILKDEVPAVVSIPEDELPAVASILKDEVPAVVSTPEVAAGTAAASAREKETPPALATTEAPSRRRHRPKPRFVAPPVRRPPPDPSKHPVAFLKRVAVAEMQAMARRLDAAQHYTTVQDLLDLPTPTLRVLIWPKPGLLDPVPGRILATMELCLNEDNGTLSTSYWWGTRPGYVIPMAQAPASELSLEWTQSQVLDFLQAVLSQL
jgi:hypothetical protein